MFGDNSRGLIFKIALAIIYKLVEFSGKTRSKDVTINEGVDSIRQDILRRFKNYSEQDATLINELTDFVIDTVIATKSLAQTIDKVDKVYKFS